MNAVEWVLFLAGLGATLAAGAHALAGSRGRAGGRLLQAGAAALLALAAVRWVRAGHPPLFGTFEASLSDAACVALFAAAWERSRPRDARLARGAGLIAAGLLAHGWFFPRAPLPLTISERSLWVDLHAAAGYAAFAAFSGAGVAAAVRLVRADLPRLDDLQQRLLSVAFALLTALIAAGAWYNQILFDSFWRWDPVECLAAIAWLSCALVLHAHAFFGWRGRRLAGAVLLTSVAVLLLYLGVPHLSRALTYHVFDLGFD